MIEQAIRNNFVIAKEREWNKTYWVVDIHSTIIKPNYTHGLIPDEWYPLAQDALIKMSNRKDICLILYTCSHPNEIEEYLKVFTNLGINFEYVNENPEVKNKGYGCYDKKFYMNVLFEDKAGFDATTDWKYVIDALDNETDIVSFTPEDWGFEFNDNLVYDLKLNENITLRIGIDFNTNNYIFEVIRKYRNKPHYTDRYNGPITSRRFGDTLVQNIFKEYNLKDKTYAE